MSIQTKMTDSCASPKLLQIRELAIGEVTKSPDLGSDEASVHLSVEKIVRDDCVEKTWKGLLESK